MKRMSCVVVGNNLYLCFLFITVILLIASTAAIVDADINKICLKSINPSFCLHYLKTQPKISTIHLTALARISIESIRATALATSKKTKFLAQKATTLKLKVAYTSCTYSYNDAVGNLDEAKNFLAVGDSASVNIRVSAALDDADSCLEDLKSVHGDAPFVKSSKNYENICDIVLIISNMLSDKT